MRFRWGGKIRWQKSRTWIGFHNTWISPGGKEWEFTLQRPKKHPWYYIPFCYKGVIKKVI
jgi:hypothetical protein